MSGAGAGNIGSAGAGGSGGVRCALRVLSVAVRGAAKAAGGAQRLFAARVAGKAENGRAGQPAVRAHAQGKREQYVLPLVHRRAGGGRLPARAAFAVRGAADAFRRVGLPRALQGGRGGNLRALLCQTAGFVTAAPLRGDAKTVPQAVPTGKTILYELHGTGMLFCYACSAFLLYIVNEVIAKA